MNAPLRDLSIEATALPRASGAASGHDEAIAAAAYYTMLTGRSPATATVDDDVAFDRHVLASILSVAATESGPVAARAGLDAAELAVLAKDFAFFPQASAGWSARDTDADSDEEQDEVAMLRDLLLSQRSTEGPVGRSLAAMVARRAVEPNHLWEDLGLRDRSELTRLLLRHFAPLASRNTQNMRWKRFFYRMLCEQDGFVMCTTPVCTQCQDFDLCFGDESGEGRMADRRREASLRAASSSVPSPLRE